MSILSSIRNSRYAKITASFILYGMASQLLFPLRAFALTGGPSQPEVESFTPVSSSDMVNLFTGDFSYNIPLLDVGGYPINLGYDANIGVEEEASWVGLGWNLNPGNISRNMRGVPDDFNGSEEDGIKVSRNSKRSYTIGINASFDAELFGRKKNSKSGIDNPNLRLNLGLTWNNYSGVGVSYGAQPPTGKDIKGFTPKIGYGSNSGIDADLSFADGPKAKEDTWQSTFISVTKKVAVKGGISTSINSRQGIKQLGFSYRKTTSLSAKVIGVQSPSVITGITNGGSSISFGNSTYTPTSTPDFCTYAFSGTLRPGKEMIGFNAAASFGVNFYTAGVADRHREKTYKSVGSLYQSNANNMVDEDLMMDFNRSGDGGFNKASDYLSFVHTTYDVLNVSGQGIGGVYRPHFGSFGSVYDARSVTKFSPSLGLGLDFAPIPGTVKVGVDVSFDFVWGNSGRWDNTTSNRTYNLLTYKPSYVDSDFESVYLKNAGEKTIVDEDYMYNIGDEKPVRSKLLKNRAFRTVATEDIENPKLGYIKTLDNLKRIKRDKRNQVITTLTNEEAKTYGLLKEKSFLNDAHRQKHHIAEISVLNPDGNRYVYGIAAYNKKQIEASFAIGKKLNDNKLTNLSSGLVGYVDGDDDGLDNELGLDNFFNSEETPPYAHSYLLSAVLSPDYMDVREDGPTTDDMGTYCYFSYKKTYDAYQWRIPYENATLSLGLQSTNVDDKASYIYGEKEIWYMDTMRTKTHIAIFYTSARADAIEASGKDGSGKGTNALHRLDSIKLFTLTEWDRSLYKGNPIALKTVYFIYKENNNNDDELCKGIPNGPIGRGKLTLEKIYFTYGNSALGKLSPYEFVYTGTSESNYSYNRSFFDVWGNYKVAKAPLHNSEYPYVDQSDRSEIDKNAAAWTLKQIKLPSGGTINIELEADDYAFVQNKRAMQMMPVVGAGESIGGGYSNLLYNKTILDGITYNNTIVFDLIGDNKISDYIDSKMTYLYFSFFINQTSSESNYEYINGYAEIDSYGMNPGETQGYVKLKGVKLQSRSINKVANPIVVASMDFAKQNLRHLIYPSTNTMSDKTNVWKVAKGLLGFIPELSDMALGHNQAQIQRNRSKQFSPEKSFIRLYNPDYKKAGGGSRVKSIKINNNWDDMTGSEETDRIYGQTYQYTTELKDVGTISSGVASYEPMLGAAENPYREPDFYKLRSEGLFSGMITHYYDVPVGESVYPGATVGYSKVRVTNLKPSDIGSSESITRHATGYTENEFYTAKDFPVESLFTEIDKDIRKDKYQALLGIGGQFSTASQGFCVILNDMHGKTKKTSSYNEYGDIINYTEYKYFVEDEKKDELKLKNRVTVLYKDGTVENDVLVGQETDFVTDPRQSEEYNTSIKYSNNVDMFIAGLVPIVVPSFGLNVGFNHEVTRTITSSKVIQKYGIVKSVTVHDLGSEITTENIAFDPETGEVLVTKTQNEYDGDIYKFTYPAHWAYEGMQGAYKNIGLMFQVDLDDSKTTIGDADILKALYPGDELELLHGIDFDPSQVNDPTIRIPAGAWGTQTKQRVWVLDKYNSEVSFITRDGDKISNGDYIFKIIRSGRRNMQTTPIGELVLKTTPISTYTAFASGTDKILKASAVTYSDYWQTYRSNSQCFVHGEGNCNTTPALLTTTSCEGSSCCSALCINGLEKSNINYVDGIVVENHHKPFPIPGDKINPYVWGIKGNWRPDVAYTYFERDDSYASRQLTMTGGNPNATLAEEDGILKGFVPFWAYSSSSWKTSNELNPYPARNPWISSVTTKQISPEGIEMESQDAMGIYSSAIYSYIHKMPVAVSANSELRNILNENFEDYDFYDRIFNCITKNWTESNCYGTYIEQSRTNIPEFTNMMNSPMHWYVWPWFFYDNPNNKGFYIDTVVSHSGMNSVAVWNKDVSIDIDLYTKTQQPSNPTRPIADYIGYYNEFIDKFSPITNKEYILTYWIKRENSEDNGKGEIIIQNQSGNITLTPFATNTNKIEGWERVTKRFTLPSGSTKIKVVFSSGTATYKINFDDLRIYPYVASMKTFVYNKRTKRLMSTLDENNYATFFEYDAEGNLIRTKRETERGIMTISENRQNIKH